MSYKAILAAISGGSAAEDTIELASRLARRFEASIEGFHVQIDPMQIIVTSFDGGAIGMPLPMEWIDDITREAAATAAAARSLFLASVERHQIPVTDISPLVRASASWRVETGDASALLIARARFFDLIVVGRSERVAGNPHSDAIEKVVCHSGRPVLIAPKIIPPTIGDSIAIGWNGSAESVKAVAAAMPFLERAHNTTVLTIDANEETDVASLIRYLERHGIASKHLALRSTEAVDEGDQLIKAASDIRADLLVLGGFGHMPWRESLFGGATRSVLWASAVPIFLMH